MLILVSWSLKGCKVTIWKQNWGMLNWAWASQVALVTNMPVSAGEERDVGLIPGSGGSEEGMATHSSILAWRIPWMQDPGGLQSIGSQRVGHNWNDFNQFSSVAQLCPTLWPHGSQHTRLPCSQTPRACSYSCPSCQWCHPTISSSVVPFSSRLRSFPASGSFPDSVLYIRWPKYCIRSFPDSVIQFFTSGGPSIAVSASASILPMNIQDWFPLGLTGFISLQSRGRSRVFSNTTVQKHQLFGTQLSL